MKKSVRAVCFAGLTTLMVGCTSTEVGTATGGAAGAGLGYAVGGGWGAALGAGAGALIGNQIGRQVDDNRYHHRHGYRPYGYRNQYYY
jgi:hypothetical protein